MEKLIGVASWNRWQTDLSTLCWLQAAELIIHSKNNLSYLWQTNGGTEDIITVVQQNKVEMVKFQERMRMITKIM